MDLPEARRNLTISVLGAGYVGLVTAACLARMGHTVRCVDRNTERVDKLSRGVVSFREPGLDEALAEGLANGRLTFADDASGLRASEAVFIAVGTLDEREEWTSRSVESAVLDLARDPDAPRTMIIRSTLMPGVTARLQERIRDLDATVELAFNPEFTRQGSAVRDFFTPDRIVLGLTLPEDESRARAVVGAAYAALNAPLIVTDSTSAELIKVGANTFLALKVGYADEIVRIAAATGADAFAVIEGIGLDKRIGSAFLTPGPGFGGSCLPSQARALPQLAADRGVQAPILAALDGSNRRQSAWVVETLEGEIGTLNGKRLALLGLTFKAGTDDLRESPAVAIARGLVARGAELVIHDPLALAAAVKLLAADGIAAEAATDPLAALARADAVVITTEWPAYRAIDWTAAAETMAGRTVLDARGIADVDAVIGAGLILMVHGRRARCPIARTGSHS